MAQGKGGVGKLRSTGAKLLDVVGDVARAWKGQDAVPLQERLQREAASLRGEDVERGEGGSAPAEKYAAWVERAEWIRLFERWAVAREIGAKVPESMSPEAWAWILGAPRELAKSNLRDLEALLSEMEGWRGPLVNAAGRLQAYGHALEELRLLPDGDEEQLPRLHKETKRALEELMKGLMALAEGARRMPSGDVR
ncbi:MAG: hypothetical protein NXI35_35300 [bacterium]|nr:hypothetical protein [bacterium]